MALGAAPFVMAPGPIGPETTTPPTAQVPFAPPATALGPGPQAALLADTDPVGTQSGRPTDYYALTPAALGQSISVTVRSAAFDAMIYLVDSDGRVLASDDNGGGGRDALLSFPFTPAPGQTYYIAVTSAPAGGVGGYFLERVDIGTTPPVTTPVIVPTNPVVPPTATGPQPIGLGQRLEGMLQAGDSAGRRAGFVDTYSFAIAAPGFVQIDAASDAFDAYVQLFDSRGTLVAEDDDTGPDTDSQLIAEVAPGEYRAEVSGFDATAAGAYTIRLQDAPLLTDPIDLRLGDDVDSAWSRRHPTDSSGDHVALFRLEHSGNRDIAVWLAPEGGRGRCALELLGRGDRVVERARTTDDGCVLIASIDNGIEYVLSARGPRGEQDAPFRLETSIREENFRWQSLSLGRDANGEITPRSYFSDYDVPAEGYTIELTGGDNVTIRVDDTDLDARLWITDTTGTEIASTNDSRALSRGYSFRVPETGWYRLIVAGQDRWYDNFTLRVDRR